MLLHFQRGNIHIHLKTQGAATLCPGLGAGCAFLLWQGSKDISARSYAKQYLPQNGLAFDADFEHPTFQGVDVTKLLPDTNIFVIYIC